MLTYATIKKSLRDYSALYKVLLELKVQSNL